jgi:glutathione S-transferase
MPGHDESQVSKGGAMLKIWGRKNSANVQKVMWAVGELGLPHQHTDLAGAVGGNREPSYLALNPNGLVPTIQDGDFVLWESNAVVRYLSAKYGAGTLASADVETRARADQWMDWQLSVVAPAIFGLFWGLIRTPEDKRDLAAIAASKAQTTDAMKILDAQLGKTRFVAGEAFCMGDIPVAIVAHRFRQLVPDRPALPHLERWFGAIETRPAFQEHVLGVPLT